VAVTVLRPLALVVALGLALGLAFGLAQAQEGCDPNYSQCLPAYPPDIDCGAVPYDDLRVTGDDVHELDADGDGLACEDDDRRAGQHSEEPTPTATQPPAVPDAGVGGYASPGGFTFGWLVAGLLGAGLAWLCAGAVAALLQPATAQPRPRGDVPYPWLKMRAWGSAKSEDARGRFE
jgi:hypothetical protein